MSIATTQTQPRRRGGSTASTRPTCRSTTQYTYAADGTGVHAYVLDTGVRTTHTDFGGRASVGDDEIGGAACIPTPTSESGHATHVAGTIGGSIVRRGQERHHRVGAGARTAAGAAQRSQVIDGVDWVTANAVKPAVANHEPRHQDDRVEHRLRRRPASIASRRHLRRRPAATATRDACASRARRGSPPRSPSVRPLKTDSRASYSNFGTVPRPLRAGRRHHATGGITSDWNTSDTATDVDQRHVDGDAPRGGRGRASTCSASRARLRRRSSSALTSDATRREGRRTPGPARRTCC